MNRIYKIVIMAICCFYSCRFSSETTAWEKAEAAFIDTMNRYHSAILKNRLSQWRDAAMAPDSIQDEFLRLQKEKKEKVDAIAGSVSSYTAKDKDRLWLYIQLLSEGGRYQESLKKIDEIAARKTIYQNYVLAEKTKVLLLLNRPSEALRITTELESKPLPPHFLSSIYLHWIFHSSNIALQMEYARKFLELPSLPQSEFPLQNPVALKYSEWLVKDGKTDQAVRLISKLAHSETGSLWKKRLEAQARLFTRIGQPGPIPAATQWIFPPPSSRQEPNPLPRVILFWTPWCSICANPLSQLVRFGARMTSPGLKILICTRLYGKGDQPETGYLPPSEEIEWIRNRLQDQKAVFPTAVLKDKDWEDFHISMVPTWILINNQGIIEDAAIGSLDEPTIEVWLRRLSENTR